METTKAPGCKTFFIGMKPYVKHSNIRYGIKVLVSIGYLTKIKFVYQLKNSLCDII